MDFFNCKILKIREFFNLKNFENLIIFQISQL